MPALYYARYRAGFVTVAVTQNLADFHASRGTLRPAGLLSILRMKNPDRGWIPVEPLGPRSGGRAHRPKVP